MSWIRQKDLHVLSSGLNKYTQDNRIQVLHKNGTETWNLKIRDAIESDSGVYECQINTEPKISSSVILNVTGKYPILLMIIWRGIYKQEGMP